MGLFKSKIEILQSKITTKNLSLLTASELISEYHLEKLLAWQEEFDEVEWEEFHKNWLYCDHCGEYSEGFCICYAR